jgi:ribosomal protein S18 acetylase RimI-like enzyme
MIRRVEDDEPRIGEFIGKEFADYAVQNGVELNYDDFCFVEEEDGKILGAITGRAYYDEVHVVDLIVDPGCRRSGLGSRLVATVEEAYRNKGYAKITLTTFGFQAPEFYKKLGYQIEFVRESKDPKLSKYFLSKAL